MHLVKSRPKLFIFVALFVLVGAFAVAQIIQEPGPAYSALEKVYYLTAEDAQWTRPGLQLTIQNVTIGADRKAQVTYRITDANGIAIDREGKFTPGAVSSSFILAYIPKNATQHVAYTTRVQTSPITHVSAAQAGTDSGGTYASLGDGLYTYTFAKVLPADYDTTTTHTVGIYATRNLTTYGLSLYVANATKDFVPNGSPVTKIREVVKTAACNACHDPLAAHGSTGRQTMEICILCHQPQTIDPDTGNTVDMKVMTHKIHMGANLPSVKAGKPYTIIGNAQAVQDYSTVAFPMDIRNCENCHKDSAQVDNWWANPTAVTCGSCHDDVNFQTGLNHEGGPQPSDKYCTYCHWEKSDWEYDSTIRGAHTPTYKSKQLVYPTVQITGITNTAPGQKPVVSFKITDKGGNTINPAGLAGTAGRLAVTIGGPTSDYSWYIQETADKAAYAGGVATYSFTGAIPATASGTYSAEIEGRIVTTLNPGTVKQTTYQESWPTAVKSFAVTGTLTERRKVVDLAKCNKCHDKLQLHGSNRNTIESCVICHNPATTDVGRRTTASLLPAQSIDLKFMIHRIHTGEELTTDYTIYGFGNTPNSFNEVRYPGDRRDCMQCHLAGTYALPTHGVLATTTPRSYTNPTQPTAAACLGCHDTADAASHAFVNTATFGEACSVCHKETADAAVSKVHAR